MKKRRRATKRVSKPKKTKKAETIFVSIASYRDKELVPTIDDMLAQAHLPENLRVCICWQHDEDEDISKYKDDPRFLIIDVPYKEAKGVCWARNLIQRQLKNEDYILQLDSHHRFFKGWDSILKQKISKLKEQGYPKPVISAYLPGYEPQSDPKSRVKEKWRLCFDRFLPEGAIFLKPATIPKKNKGMERARFISGHMVFAERHFYETVKYDPNLYFHGEETSLGVRAFTHGYDVFHLDRAIMWHFYERSGSVRHWDDSSTWQELNTESFKRFKALFGVDGEPLQDFEEYGLGKERTLQEYEEFAGIDFKSRRIHKDTKAELPPPVNGANLDEYLNDFKYCIDLHKDEVSENDCDFFAIAFTNSQGQETIRLDADEPEIVELMNQASSGDGFLRIWRSFDTAEVPKTWVVLPRSKSKGFLDRIERDLPIA